MEKNNFLPILGSFNPRVSSPVVAKALFVVSIPEFKGRFRTSNIFSLTAVGTGWDVAEWLDTLPYHGSTLLVPGK